MPLLVIVGLPDIFHSPVLPWATQGMGPVLCHPGSQGRLPCGMLAEELGLVVGGEIQEAVQTGN